MCSEAARWKTVHSAHEIYVCFIWSHNRVRSCACKTFHQLFLKGRRIVFTARPSYNESREVEDLVNCGWLGNQVNTAVMKDAILSGIQTSQFVCFVLFFIVSKIPFLAIVPAHDYYYYYYYYYITIINAIEITFCFLNVCNLFSHCWEWIFYLGCDVTCEW
jgi:hypothetical protein